MVFLIQNKHVPAQNRNWQMLLKYRIFILFFFLLPIASAQNIAIGQWRVHLPYNDAVAVTEAGNKIYCASHNGLFYYDKSDNSVKRLSKINGLSDIEISTIRYNQITEVLIIAYANANIDLISGNKIINIADIKRKNMLGKTAINNIICIDEYAYLCCEFGIVVLNTAKQEIKDTYYLSPNNDLNVIDLTSDGNKFFAATVSGIYTASIGDVNISNYTAWTKQTNVPDGKYNTICYYNNKLYANLVGGWDKDTIFVYDGKQWKYYDATFSWSIRKIETYYNKLVITNRFSAAIFDTLGKNISLIDNYNSSQEIHPLQAVIDKENHRWVADNVVGLIHSWDHWNLENLTPNSPFTKNVVAMASSNNDVWVATGSVDPTWTNLWHKDGVLSLVDNYWKTYNSNNTKAFDTVFDVLSVAIDPSNNKHVYAGSWGKGLLEFLNGNLIADYSDKGTFLQQPPKFWQTNWVAIGGLAFDKDNNLWITNPKTPNPLVVKKTDGTWQSFTLGGLVKEVDVTNILVDSYNQKWIILPRGNGIIVFNDNNTLSDTKDDKTKRLSTDIGNGKLSSNNVICMAEDLDGQIWVGTEKGIAVFYSPDKVFSGENFDAQQIFVQQDGHTQILLETETVTAIAIDGANRKWLGTQNGGVFLMSADGTQQIEHFTTENSPLLSNAITSIAINQQTGEIFFGTEKGIISYKGTATEGVDDNQHVLVYPNPVREDFTGLIGIRGLVKDANIKITDVSGNLVYETKANGGQAIWNGKNFSGEKAHTGVYLVFCSNDDGSKTLVTKLLVIH